MNINKVCLTALLGALSTFACAAQPAAASEGFAFPSPTAARARCTVGRPIEADVTVERVVDGDTIVIRTESGSYSVRMMGMDTPETHFQGRSQGYWGDVAADRMAELVQPGDDVRLEFGDDGCDRYGRVLAWVWKDGRMLNEEMVREGLAVSYCIGPSSKHCDELGELTNKAVAARKGMFSARDLELPYDFRTRVSGRAQTKYVGNLKTKEVLLPGSDASVPVGDRIYFYTRTAIRAPFHLIEN